jgi:fatty acid desaturase
MHHPENNLEADLSTTLPYVRDRFPHFAQYWLRFFIPGLPHLVMYLLGHRRHKLARQLVIGEGAWLLAVVLLGVLNPVATFWTLVAPFLLLRVLMMCGNFAQHAFVDVDDPNNAFRNSTCLINTPYNHVAFNDGYHIVHHVKANLHWSEMAQWYDDNRERFAAEDAVVFDGLFDNQHVWWLLMRQRYDILADHLVDFRNRSKEEKIRFLQSRTRRTRGAFPTLFAPAITPTAPSPAI